MSYLARSANDKGQTQLLRTHLIEVARQAKEFAASCGGGDEAWWAGLLHDVGKFRMQFQEYLSGKRKGGIDTHHAPYGAAIAAEKEWGPMAFAIAGHHSGLHDAGSLQDLISNPIYKITTRLPPLMQWFTEAFGLLPDGPISPGLVAEGPLSSEYYTRMLFSCLVDADRLDAERHASGVDRQIVRLGSVVNKLIGRLMSERQGKSRDGKLNRLRHAVFDECLEAAKEDRGFFSLTVPTGGGKTLSSMAFALAHAEKHSMDRVIVVIPYLSIIEQNALEYRRILDPEGLGLVVEHHSAVKEKYDSHGETPDLLTQAADNWDAPVIVTTSVQFIESLFAASPGGCRKLHNIANSVVVLDEVQTLPSHLLNPLLHVMKELDVNYGVSFLLMTATQPAFRRRPSLSEGFDPGEVREIITDKEGLFSALKRVEYHGPEKLDLHSLATRLLDCRQVLCVVNLRRHAARLWEELRDALPLEEKDSVFHLSSSMCAEHRLQVLGEGRDPSAGSIRHRLRNNLPCRLISTQVVEAGVDIDFPTVYRALGPLDAIAQAAGRCNREGRLQDELGQAAQGHVYIFSPEDNGLPPGVYTTATGISAVMLPGCLRELGQNPDVFARYFAQLYDLTDTDNARRGESSIQEDRSYFRFREVARKAKVIADEGRPVLVPFGQGAKRINEIRGRKQAPGAPRFDRHDLRRLQRFMVNVREREFAQLTYTGMAKPLLPNIELYVLEEGCYHEHLGLVIENRPLEDFIL